MVLVTGGTGLLGAHLLLHLLRKQISVRAIHRKGSNLANVERVFGYYNQEDRELFHRVDWVVADLNDIPALEKAFENIDFVYHAAALISFDPGNYQQLMKVNAEGTSNIVNLCIAHGVKKLCYASTIGTIGKSTNGAAATEENEWNDHRINVYAQSKYAAEIEVWRGSQEGLPVIMVNPGVIIGPGFWNTGSGALFTTANKGYKYYPPGGTGFISVYDVVNIMVVLMNSDITNERFITVAKNLSYMQVLTAITHYLGRPKPTKKLDYWQLEVARIGDIIWNFFTGSGRRITRNSIYSMKHRDAYSSEKVKKALNFEFEALEKSIAFSCKRFKEENL